MLITLRNHHDHFHAYCSLMRYAIRTENHKLFNRLMERKFIVEVKS